MRVFVTGATGFVMGAVARALRARGDAVTALVRDPSRAGSLAAFGNTHGAVVAEGYRPTSPPTSSYEDTKRRAHDIALDAAKSGAQIVIVQPGQVYGPNDHSAVGANFRALAEGRLRYRAFEDLGLNLVHVDDLADGIVRALDRGPAA